MKHYFISFILLLTFSIWKTYSRYSLKLAENLAFEDAGNYEIDREFHHECIHDKLNITSRLDVNNEHLGEYNNPDHIDRVLQSQNWQPIRILADFSGIL